MGNPSGFWGSGARASNTLPEPLGRIESLHRCVPFTKSPLKPFGSTCTRARHWRPCTCLTKAEESRALRSSLELSGDERLLLKWAVNSLAKRKLVEVMLLHRTLDRVVLEHEVVPIQALLAAEVMVFDRLPHGVALKG